MCQNFSENSFFWSSGILFFLLPFTQKSTQEQTLCDLIWFLWQIVTSREMRGKKHLQSRQYQPLLPPSSLCAALPLVSWLRALGKLPGHTLDISGCLWLMIAFLYLENHSSGLAISRKPCKMPSRDPCLTKMLVKGLSNHGMDLPTGSRTRQR